MARPIHTYVTWAIALLNFVAAQQQCYFGAGANNRGPTNLVPCMTTGQSACCLLGDICLSGNTCWNFDTGNLYQYGCTDISYKDKSCPYKCGFNSSMMAIHTSHAICANQVQPCRLGQLSSTVLMSLVSTTHGYATRPKAVGAIGALVQICSYCNLDNVRTWDRTLESLSTLHPYSRHTYPYLPISAEAPAISLQRW